MKVLSCICMLLGCFLGAGFVSGREISSYFSRFGNQSIWGIIVATILLFLFIWFFLKLSDKTRNFDKFSKFYFGKFDYFASFLMAISVLIVISSMFAGMLSLAETFEINSIIFVATSALLSYFILKGSLKSLRNINMVLMPFLLIVLVVTTFMKIQPSDYNSNIIMSIASGGNYVFINIVTLGLFLLEIGYQYTNKEKIIISILSSLLIGLMIVIINNAILCSGSVYEIFPNLALASKNQILFLCMQISIFIGLFTTLISNALILTNYLNNFTRNNNLSIVICICLALILSQLGFEIVVGYVYWIIGLIGIIMVSGVLIKKLRRIG